MAGVDDQQAGRAGRGAAPRLVLASASPRRRALLEAAGASFTVEPSAVDETLHARPASPQAAARILAARKAAFVALRHAGEDVVVLGSDTIVAVGDGLSFELLGKPVDADDERRMLRLLSASRHQVATGVCAIACRGADPRLLSSLLDSASEPRDPAVACGVETTFVTMRALGAEEIEAYVESGEWVDKAGGYAIQESADRFVTLLEGGGFDNVVGLPVELALRLVAQAASGTRR